MEGSRGGMWRVACWGNFVLIVAVGAPWPAGVWCHNMNFSLEPSDLSGFNCSIFCDPGVPCTGNPGCGTAGSALQLPFVGTTPRNSTQMAVRFMRSEPVQMWDAASGQAASFQTFFVLKVSEIPGFKVGEGFTFLIAPNTIAPNDSAGGGLGMFTEQPENESDEYDKATTTGPTPNSTDYRMLALEFDLAFSKGDPDTLWPYVSLLVRGLPHDSPSDFKEFSNATMQALTTDPSKTFTGNMFGVWIDYDDQDQTVRLKMLWLPNTTSGFDKVGLSRKDNATAMFDKAGVDLRALVNEQSYVGFSASTSDVNVETNEVFFWQFQSTMTARPIKDDANGLSAGAITGIALGASALGLVLFVAPLIIWLLLRRRRMLSMPRRGSGRRSLNLSQVRLGSMPGGGSGIDVPRFFTYDQLRKATDNFSQESLLGEGGFGKVYKGTLATGALVAVKRVSQESQQGEKEFVAEVTIIGRLRHKNLVSLQGWCHDERRGELLLVYDFMPNGSLDQHVLLPPQQQMPMETCTPDSSGCQKLVRPILHMWDSEPVLAAPLPADDSQQRPVLSWAARYHIIRGVASALVYLHEDWHEQCVVHRDVKSSNVMLDEDWNARLGDFGLARLMEKKKFAQTASRIMGTQGYLAPDVTYTGRISAQADVYSFGVVALEVAAGRRPIEWFRLPKERFLVTWVRHLHQEGRLEDAADPALKGQFHSHEMQLALKAGLLCTQDEAVDRPTMRQVVRYLGGETASLVVPSDFLAAQLPELRDIFKMLSESAHSASETSSSSSYLNASSVEVEKKE